MIVIPTSDGISSNHQLEGRVGASIDIVNFRLLHSGNVFELDQKTLDEGMKWLGDRLNRTLSPREYDMPDHEVANGAKFNPNSEHLQSIADGFKFGELTLNGHGDLRVWPHHFDLGFLIPDVADGKSIGGGFSLGDEHFPLPYIYINPYGMDRPESLPLLEPGCWTDKWFGAIITTEQFAGPEGENVARSFVEKAVSSCVQLLSEK